jgi:photosystem II stability/assembly factor-like uncharacterized protein
VHSGGAALRLGFISLLLALLLIGWTPPGAARPVTLLAIHMASPGEGWAVSEHDLLRTTDGGTRWAVVRRFGAQLFGGELAGQGSRYLWLAYPARGGSRILSTADGGGTWRVSRPLYGAALGSFTGSTSLAFVDPAHGWFLATGGAAAGSAQYSLYRTTDGGLRWSRLAYTDLTAKNPSHGGLPVCDCLYGLSFRDPQVGWVTGAPLAVERALIFYRTSDGGATWQAQPLPLPHGFQQFDVSISPPAFFGAIGVLPVAFIRPNAFVLYLSRDGGASWEPTTPIRARRSVGEADAFALSPQLVWAWIPLIPKQGNSHGGLLYQTEDGGRHWSRPVRLPYVGTPELDFVSAQVGFALGWVSVRPVYGLMKTVDGGRSWHRLQTRRSEHLLRYFGRRVVF